jgi:hypothetical protein
MALTISLHNKFLPIIFLLTEVFLVSFKVNGRLFRLVEYWIGQKLGTGAPYEVTAIEDPLYFGFFKVNSDRADKNQNCNM